jgi:hypothetical protein
VPTTSATAATAHALLTLVRPFGPAAEADELVFESDPPAELEAALRVLHTGVRALLARGRWYGCDGDTGRVVELNPAAPLPAGIALLCVEGDHRWDRIDPAARMDLPQLFEILDSCGR